MIHSEARLGPFGSLALPFFLRTTRPENGPFIVKFCHIEVDDVIDVTGFSRARLAKAVLISPVKYENQRSRSEVCDLAVRLG
jgi:hypothetical protein